MTSRALVARAPAFPGRVAFAGAALAWAAIGCAGGCGRGGGSGDAASHGEAGLVSAPSATAAGVPRPGMQWVPPGVLRAGTPVDRVPRIADEELPGTETALSGYYIDLLPYPNEAAAIPTTNVNREDARHLCESKGKRLCTELEWERACKGPDNTTYEYGDTYQPGICDTGVAVERAAKQPSGERHACKSTFGVLEMHGGPWEWTDSTWGRGQAHELGVLRGGNALAGELVARCANGLARPPSSKSATMGFRCCAGPRNEATVQLALVTGVALERSMKTAELGAPLLPLAAQTWGQHAIVEPAFTFVHAWKWRPVTNEELVVASGCTRTNRGPSCGLLVARVHGEDAGEPSVVELARVDTGLEASEVAEVGDARHLRLKGLDAKSAYLRDFTYVYGRIELGDLRR